jgi:hypothetical protein
MGKQRSDASASAPISCIGKSAMAWPELGAGHQLATIWPLFNHLFIYTGHLSRRRTLRFRPCESGVYKVAFRTDSGPPSSLFPPSSSSCASFLSPASRSGDALSSA